MTKITIGDRVRVIIPEDSGEKCIEGVIKSVGTDYALVVTPFGGSKKVQDGAVAETKKAKKKTAVEATGDIDVIHVSQAEKDNDSPLWFCLSKDEKVGYIQDVEDTLICASKEFVL